MLTVILFPESEREYVLKFQFIFVNFQMNKQIALCEWKDGMEPKDIFGELDSLTSESHEWKLLIFSGEVPDPITSGTHFIEPIEILLSVYTGAQSGRAHHIVRGFLPAAVWCVGYREKRLRQRRDAASFEYVDENRRFGSGFRLIDILQIFASISVFMYSYLKTRSKAMPFVIETGTDFLEFHDGFLGMYVSDGDQSKYRLSERWRFVKWFLLHLILIDLVLLIPLHIYTGCMNVSIFEFDSRRMIPIICIVFLLESYSLLRYKESGEEAQQAKDGADPMNLLKLLADHSRFADENQISAHIAYQEHQVELQQESCELQEQCRNSENGYVRYLMNYVDGKIRQGHLYPSQCIDTAVRLTRGENVFFATPFYKDIDICMFFPIFLALLKREKALILVEDDGNLDAFCRWVKEGIEDVQDLIDLWNVAVLREHAQDTDVGILSFQNVCQMESIPGLRAFLGDVSFVVVLEAADLLTGGQEAVSNLAEKIGEQVGGCSWLLCDRNAESILDLFSHLLNAEFIYVSATPMNAAHMVTAHWDLETEPAQIWSPIQRYLSIGAGILETAGDNRVGRVTWYGEETMPVQDWNWILGQYYLTYGVRTRQVPRQTSINDVVRCEISGISCQRADENFIIVEDSVFNLYEMQRQYATRGKDKLALHILSPNYMLRNFMRDIEETMQADAKYIAQFVPEYVNSYRNVSLKLVRRMLEGPVSETEAEEIFRKCDERHETVPCIIKIRRAIQQILNVEDADIAVTYRTTYSEKNRTMKQEPCYQLVDSAARREFDKYFHQAKYLDEYGLKKYIGRLFLSGHLEQKYLSGQFVALDGKYYEVMGYSTTEYEKILEVKRASEQIFRRRYYRQCRKYTIAPPKSAQGAVFDNAKSKIIFQGELLQLRRCIVDVEGSAYGYMELDSWNGIMQGRFVEAKSGPRKYLGKQILEIELLQDKPDHIASFIWLAVLLNEIFCTLYPQYYHLLSVGVNQNQYRSLMGQNGIPEKAFQTLLANIEGASDEKNCFYILEDSREDMGLLRSLERNFQRIVNILQDYIEWSQRSGDKYIEFSTGTR